MLISILMVAYAIILCLLASYLLTHRTKTFLIYDPVAQPKLAKLMTIVGVSLIIVAIFALITIFLSVWFQIAALVIGSFFTGYLAIAMTTYDPK